MLILLAIFLVLSLLLGLPPVPVLIAYGLVIPVVAFALTRSRLMLQLPYGLMMVIFVQLLPSILDVELPEFMDFLQSKWMSGGASIAVIVIATLYGIFMPCAERQDEQEQPR